MALFFMALGGLLIALANLCMRKAIEAGGHARSYILIQLALSGLWTLIAGPLFAHNFAIDSATIFYGLAAGIGLGLFMKFLGIAMARGPSSLTVAFINGSTIFPALILYLLLGRTWGFDYNLQSALGATTLLAALFWATKKDAAKEGKERAPYMKASRRWLIATLGCFSAHIFMLLVVQFRSLSLQDALPSHALILPSSTGTAGFFLPLMFACAWTLQALDAWRITTPPPSRKEWFFGALGGIANGTSIQLVAFGTLKAQMWEISMLFPLYSVSIMVTCNIWSALLYRERVFWPASFLAMAGIALGSIDLSFFVS